MRARFVAAGAAALLAGAVLAVPVLTVPTRATATAQAPAVAAGCLIPGGAAADVVAGQRLNADQQANATTIVNVTRTRQLPQRAAIISLATAYQESKFVNYLHHTDNTTSLGMYGQMTIYYGYDVATDPAKATGAFLDLLVKQPNWDTRPLTEVAADVQKPWEPYRGLYAQWEPFATALTAQLWGADCTAAPKMNTSGRIVRNGETIDCITNAVLEAVAAVVGDVIVSQGSWSSNWGPSGGTHDGAGASDWTPVNGDYDTAISVARAAGGIAWHRLPNYNEQGELVWGHHVHMIIDEAGISPSAAGQVVDFHNGGDGLEGPGMDDGPATYRPYAGACAA